MTVTEITEPMAARIADTYMAAVREGVSDSHDSLAAVALDAHGECIYEIADITADLFGPSDDDEWCDARWDAYRRIWREVRCRCLREVDGDRLATQHIRDMGYGSRIAPPMFLYPGEWFGRGTLGTVPSTHRPPSPVDYRTAGAQ